MAEKIKIAIVDDYKEIRMTICKYLSELDCDIIIETNSGKDLLAQLEQASVYPDICLVDYNMPHMKGDELAAILSKGYPAIKIAAMTADMEMDSLFKMIRNGCSSYFLKSSSPLEWKRGMDEILKKGYHFSEWMQKALFSFIRANGMVT